MNTEPIIFSFAAIALVLILYVAFISRIEEQDIKRQLKEYDENSYH